MKMPAGLDIERLYDEHVQPLYAFLLNFTRDGADTRDLLQEIFVQLAREMKLLAGVREERAFLMAVVLERYRLARGEFHGKNSARHHWRPAVALSGHERRTICPLFRRLE